MKNFWIGISIIVVLSLVIAYTAPINEFYKGMAVMPAVGGLLAALFQLFRDNLTHEKKLQLQEKEQIFNLGATSHMANTVFDKHVEFCEKYLAEVHQLVVTLTREGPTENTLKHTGNLYKLRIEYTAWITPEIDSKLIPFEKVAKQIGANAGLAKALSGTDSKERPEAVIRMFDAFKDVMDWNESTVKDADATVSGIKNRVREILQVDQLVSIREYLVEKASSVKNAAKE